MNKSNIDISMLHTLQTAMLSSRNLMSKTGILR